MISKYAYKNSIWLNLEDPTKEEFESVQNEYNLTESRSVLDSFLLPLPLLSSKKTPSISFIVGPNFIITRHSKEINPFQTAGYLFEEDSIFNSDTQNTDEHFSRLYDAIIRSFYESIRSETNIFPIFRKHLLENRDTLSTSNIYQKIKNSYEELAQIRRILDAHVSVSGQARGIEIEHKKTVEEIDGQMKTFSHLMDAYAYDLKKQREAKNRFNSTVVYIIIGILTGIVLIVYFRLI